MLVDPGSDPSELHWVAITAVIAAALVDDLRPRHPPGPAPAISFSSS